MTNIKLLEKSAEADHEANDKIVINSISNLPDPVIGHILSFLQTEEAVATSILSSTWRTIWTEVPTLHFSRPKDDLKRKSRPRLCDVINRVFESRKSPIIRKFRLTASVHDDGCNSRNLGAWVSATVAGKIEKLVLNLYASVINPRVQLPQCLFTCRTIKVLKLYGNFNLDIPYPIHFPRLKILRLCSVHWGLDSDVRILSGCPVLEDFAIQIDNKTAHPAIRVCAPSLKKLRIYFGWCKIGQIKMNTPCLEYFRLVSSDVEKYWIGDLKNLVEARLNQVIVHGSDAFHSLLKALYNVKFLTLRSVQVSFLGVLRMDGELQIHRLSVFQNLVRLHLTLKCPDLEFLVDFLRKCPKLEVLIIFEVQSTCCPEGRGKPKGVPGCVSSHLTEFKFSDYSGSEGELEIAGYILMNAKVLKKVTVNITNGDRFGEEKKLRILRSLSLLPTVSNICQFQFD